MHAPNTVEGLDGLPVVLQVPAELLRFRGLRRDPLIAYAVLWNLAGCRPGRLTVDYLRFRVTLAGSEQGVRRWLDSLERAGLIDILHREPREAEIRIRDWRTPREDAAPVEHRGGQLDLPFVQTESTPQGGGPTTIPIWAGAARRHPVRRPPSDRPTAG